MSDRSKIIPIRFRKPKSHYLTSYDISYPNFDPVIVLKDLTKVICFKKVYLSHVKGVDDYIPQMNKIFPRSSSDTKKSEYKLFYRDSSHYKKNICRVLARLYLQGEKLSKKNSNEFNLIVTDLINKEIKEDLTFVKSQMKKVINKWYSEEKLSLEDEDTIFHNLQVFNPNIKFNIPSGSHIKSNPDTIDLNLRYTWRGGFAGLGFIQELNCSSKEIVGYEFISKDFFSNKNDKSFERNYEFMIIVPKLFNLWLQRLALASLPEEYYTHFKIYSELSDYTLTANKIEPYSEHFNNYNIRLETLDKTYTESDLKNHLKNPYMSLAQALIITKLCFGNKPYLAKLFFTFCPINILENEGVFLTQSSFCSMSGVCSLKDSIEKEANKGNANVKVYPPPYFERMINRLQLFLKNELIMKSLSFYKLNEYIFDQIHELQSDIEVFLGNLTFNKNDNSFFFSPINHAFNLVDKREYLLIPWSPFVFSTNERVKLVKEGNEFKIVFKFQRNNVELIYKKYYSEGETSIIVIIGTMPEFEFINTVKRQQKSLWTINTFQAIKEKETKTPQEITDEINKRRLKQNHKRSGIIIFGKDELAKYTE